MSDYTYKSGSEPGSGKFYSFAANKSSGGYLRSSSSKGYVGNAAAPSMESFIRAKAEADALKEARARELAARGGIPVSAQERSDLAMSQAMKYGVGVVRTDSPITIVDKGQKTTLSSADVVRMHADYFAGGTAVPDPRLYGQTEIVQRPVVGGVSEKLSPQWSNIPSDLARRGYVLNKFSVFGEQPKSYSFDKDLYTSRGYSFLDEFGKPTYYEILKQKEVQNERGKSNLQTVERGTKNSGYTDNNNGNTDFTGISDSYAPISTYKEYKPSSWWDKIFYEYHKSKVGQWLSKKYEATGLQIVGEGLTRLSKPEEAGPVGYVFYPLRKYNEFGRWEENNGVSGKLWRGVLAFGKQGLLFSNLVTASYATVGYITEFGGEFLKGPTDFVWGVGKSLYDEPLEFVGGLKGAVEGRNILRKLSFVGKQYIPQERIIEPQVLSGEQIFPSVPAQQYRAGMGDVLIKEVKSGEYNPFQKPGETWLFHASPEPIKGKTVGAGTSETAGLYGWSSLSKYFLRISSDVKYKVSFFPKNPQPTIQVFKVPVERIPRSVRERGFEAMQDFMGTPESVGKVNPPVMGSGKAYISPTFEAGLKPEKEAIISFGSDFKKTYAVTGQKSGWNIWDRVTGFKYFTEVEGKKVPIKTYEVLQAEGNPYESLLWGGKTSGASKVIAEARKTEEFRSGVKYVSFVDVAALISSAGSWKRSETTPKLENYIFEKPANSIINIQIGPDISQEEIGPNIKISTSSNTLKNYVSGIHRPVVKKENSVTGRPHAQQVGRSRVSVSEKYVSTTNIPAVGVPKPPLPPNFLQKNYPTEGFKSPSQTLRRGFFVVFREFGKEVKATARPMSFREAELFGRDVVKQSLTASYKVVPRYMAPLRQAKRTVWAVGEWVSPFRFAEGKTKQTKGFKVEKPTYRIGGVGAKVELKEARVKKKRGGFW